MAALVRVPRVVSQRMYGRWAVLGHRTLVAIYPGILDLVGNTPMVDVSRLSPNREVRLYAKLESMNPFGSVKDRAAKAMLLDAYARGLLRKGQHIVEPSSGNTGIALAGMSKVLGNTITIVLPENVTKERKDTLLSYSAHLVETPANLGSDGAIVRAGELAASNPDWFMPFQYANDANPTAHYKTTGPEILRDCPLVTHFVAGLGTSGTLMGVGRYLLEHDPRVQVVAVEPPTGETVDGLRNVDSGYVPAIFENWDGFSVLSRRRIVRAEESILCARRLVSECGIYAGPSAGAALAGALKVAESIASGHIVFIVCDSASKYLSTGIYSAGIEQARDALEKVSYF